MTNSDESRVHCILKSVFKKEMLISELFVKNQMLKGGKHRLSKVYLRFEKIDVNISIQANTELVKPVCPYFVSRACVWFVVARSQSQQNPDSRQVGLLVGLRDA